MADNLLDSGNPGSSNWWDNPYEGDASGLGSYYSATNPGTGKAESIVTGFGDSPQGTALPWSEYQKQLGAGTMSRYETSSKNPARKSDFMGDWGFLLPVGGFLGAGAAGGAFSGSGAAAGMDAVGSGACTFGGWNTLGEGAYGATGLGGGAGAASAGFDWGGATGADELLGTGGEIASGGSAGWTGATGADELLGTGGAVASGSSMPGWLTNLRAAMQSPGAALQKLFGGDSSGSPGAGSNWGSPLSLMSAASGLYGLSLADKQRKLAQLSVERSDPFASSRPQYVDRLNSLMKDPSSITGTPGYEAGLQAVERRMAAQGFNGSGNMMTALDKYGGDFYNQEVARLMQLSGANATPGSGIATAGSIDNSANDLASKSLASLGYGGRAATAPIPSPVIAAFLKSVGL